MKASTKLLLVILCMMVFVVPLMIKGPTGKPMMTLSDWLPDVSEAVDQVKSLERGLAIEQQPARLSANSGKMYKWQDEKGAWHFSEEKPLDTSNVVIEKLSDVENVMEAPIADKSKGSTIQLPGGFSLD